MAVVDLFSKRQKRLRGEVTDVYTYDTIPEPLRVQVIQILAELLPNRFYEFNKAFKDRVQATSIFYCDIVKILRREYGVNNLVDELE